VRGVFAQRSRRRERGPCDSQEGSVGAFGELRRIGGRRRPKNCAIVEWTSAHVAGRGVRAQTSKNFGADLSPAQFSGIQSPLEPNALQGTFLGIADAFPESARRAVLDNLPAPLEQGGSGHLGSPGSCEACSYGYGHVPYKPQHRPKVAGMCAYFESLNATGSSFPNMDRFIIGSYKSSGIAGAGNQAKYLSLIKELLRHRHAIASPGSCPKTLTRRYSPRTACITRHAVSTRTRVMGR
jgi:hypothetical protein